MNYELIVVALGNPGEKYSNTRHNAGFMVGSALSKKYDAEIKAGKYNFYFSELKIKGKKVCVIFPNTYMNDSGLAVKKCLAIAKQSLDSCLVIVDEYNFPLGKIHLRKGGSDGGHNGISSIIYEMESEDFYRLRFGIDKKFGQGELVEYVLSNFGNDEKALLEGTIANSITAIEHIIDVGLNKAMSGINSGKIFSDSNSDLNKN